MAGAAARATYDLVTTADGGAELDADRMVLRVAACLDELLHEAGPLAGQIGAVAIDTFVGNILGVDSAGAAVTPVYTWADTRSGRRAEQLRARLDPAAAWARTGCPIHGSYAPARLLWLASDCPDLFARASRWGVAAAIELIERIPSDSRPDVLAIYPGWWGDFPLWFGAPLDGVSVRGNVICGGLTKMIYEARWDALDGGGAPATPSGAGLRAVARIDVADVLSEAEHDYETRGALGFTERLAPGGRERELATRPAAADG